MYICKPWASVLALVAWLIACEAVARPPQVVVSIKPIHSLVTGVMSGVATPDLLVEGVASPHTYSLRPSDVQKIYAADVVFYIGPHFEFFLTKVLRSVNANVVSLDDLQEIKHLPVRPGGVWMRHGAAAWEEGKVSDPHIWLDIDNAKAMVTAIAEVLANADSDNATKYYKNANALQLRLEGLDADLRVMLEPVKDRPFFVFHDAYQYFAKRYELAEAGAIAVSPERPPGARRVAELKSYIRQAGVVCVFSEPQFEPALVETIVSQTDARRGTLDAEDGSAPPGPGHYFVLMHDLAAHLVRCLNRPS